MVRDYLIVYQPRRYRLHRWPAELTNNIVPIINATALLTTHANLDGPVFYPAPFFKFPVREE